MDSAVKQVATLFRGEWKLFYSEKGTMTWDGSQKWGIEPVKIRKLFLSSKPMLKYYAYDTLSFYLTDIKIDGMRKVSFVKMIPTTSGRPVAHARETLEVIDANTITGRDSKGFILQYTKIK